MSEELQNSNTRMSGSRDTRRHIWLIQTPDEFCTPMNFIDESSGGRFHPLKKRS
jgi:hypothetical protein